MPHGQNAKEMSFRVSLGESPPNALITLTERVGFVMKGGVVFKDELSRR
jgi:hypothetical protein